MRAIRETQAWLEKAVIGLNLCPFARAVHHKGQIRWVLSHATRPLSLAKELAYELKFLAQANPAEIDTTMLVHPKALGDFLDFNEFLGVCDQLLTELNLHGVIQIASFHPQYRFAGTGADDISNCTNRSPHPTLHLLREDSVARAVKAIPDADQIVKRNIKTLKLLGWPGWNELLKDQPAGEEQG